MSTRPVTRSGRTSPGTVSRTRSARASTSATVTSGTPGSSASARTRERSETAYAATTGCPARRSAAPSTAPARPVPTTPTRRRGGAPPAAVSVTASGTGSLTLSPLGFAPVPERVPDGPGKPSQRRAGGCRTGRPLGPAGSRRGDAWRGAGVGRRALRPARLLRRGPGRGCRAGRHFRTSVHVGPVFHGALARLLLEVDDRLGHPATLDLVDVGSGRGSCSPAYSMRYLPTSLRGYDRSPSRYAPARTVSPTG